MTDLLVLTFSALAAATLRVWMKRQRSGPVAFPEELRSWRLTLPRDGAFPPAQADAWLSSLSPLLPARRSDADHCLSLELYTEHQQIELRLHAPASFEGALQNQLAARFPGARMEAVEATQPGPLLILPFRLERSDLHAIRIPKETQPDPMPGVLAALVGRDSPSGLRLTLCPSLPAWKRWAAAAVEALGRGEPLPPRSFAGQLMLTLWHLGEAALFPSGRSVHKVHAPRSLLNSEVSRKAYGPVFRAQIVLWTCETDTGSGNEEASHQLEMLASQLEDAYRDPQGNAPIRVGKPRSASALGAIRLPEIVLSSAEIAGLFHVPSSPLPLLSRALSRQTAPTGAAPPVSLPGAGEAPALPAGPLALAVPMGETLTPAGPIPIGLTLDERRRHTYVLGKTGTGKSTLLGGILQHDLVSGNAVGLIDPHGDLAERVLGLVPPSRRDEVVYFNPADTEFPIGFNPFHLAATQDRAFAASCVIGVFKKLYGDSWGPRLEHFLRNSLLALLETPSPTLLLLPRLLTDPEIRAWTLAQVRDPLVLAFFRDEFERYDPRFRAEAIAPILNKVGGFLSSVLVRHIVGQSDAPLDLRRVMDEGGIFIANLAAGRIGEDNAALLGGLLVAGFQLAALSRKEVPEAERRDFFLVIDEFQHFAFDAFASILAEARKFRLSLVLSHQYLGQLPPSLADAVFGNAGSLAVFRLGQADAPRLERELSPVFDAQDLIHLPNHQFCFRTTREEGSSVPFSGRTVGLSPGETDPAEIVRRSRARWARPRAFVELEIGDLMEGRIG